MNLETRFQMLIKINKYADSEFAFKNFEFNYLLLLFS